MKLLHSGDLGDVIYSLPCVRAFAAEHGPVELLLNPCTCDHPHGGKHFTKGKVEWVIPLIAAQDYISDCRQWAGEVIDLDLNLFRQLPINFGSGDIASWYRWAFSFCYDLNQPWLTVEPQKTDRIIVNRSARYHNPGINYRFMTGHRVGFVGLPAEYEAFKQDVPDASWVPVSSARELASLVAGCRLFCGNQSAPFAIAEGLKSRRLLEVSLACPNVGVHGPGGHDAAVQLGFQHWFERLT